MLEYLHETVIEECDGCTNQLAHELTQILTWFKVAVMVCFF